MLKRNSFKLKLGVSDAAMRSIVRCTSTAQLPHLPHLPTSPSRPRPRWPPCLHRQPVDPPPKSYNGFTVSSLRYPEPQPSPLSKAVPKLTKLQTYTSPPRTYNDVATSLAAIPSLSPRTRVYTHENGQSELLLQLSGTLPAVFRGQPFNVPITIWVPHEYPANPPTAFITPPQDLAVRPGNYVDPSGKCYHPYLANWAKYSEVWFRWIKIRRERQELTVPEIQHPRPLRCST